MDNLRDKVFQLYNILAEDAIQYINTCLINLQGVLRKEFYFEVIAETKRLTKHIKELIIQKAN